MRLTCLICIKELALQKTLLDGWYKLIVQCFAIKNVLKFTVLKYFRLDEP